MKITSLLRWRTQLSQLPRFSGGPGELTLAGTIAGSSGTGGGRMRVFGQWALVYSVSGRCFYEDERGTRADLAPGSWILVFPELAQRYGPAAGERWDEIYVCFRGPVFEAWRSAGCFDPTRTTGSWLPPSRGVRVFEKFFQEIQRKNCSSMRAVCLWQELLSEIVGTPHEPAMKREDWLEKAKDFLEHSDPGGGADSLRQAAQACGIGYESFRKKFESATGVPPGRYVLARRIERARRLLAMQALTNGEIAAMLGFHDEFHFSKTFSKFTGSSPRDFRRQIQQSEPADRGGDLAI
jgi:AraC-like DNA-binding protein